MVNFVTGTICPGSTLLAEEQLRCLRTCMLFSVHMGNAEVCDYRIEPNFGFHVYFPQCCFLVVGKKNNCKRLKLRNNNKLKVWAFFFAFV